MTILFACVLNLFNICLSLLNVSRSDSAPHSFALLVCNMEWFTDIYI